jgi:hypothetical protein
MVFAKLAYLESVRENEACLRSRSARVYYIGIWNRATRTNLSREKCLVVPSLPAEKSAFKYCLRRALTKKW